MQGFDERRLFSVDSAKAVKAQGYGYLNAIHYMAPAASGGHGNLCSHATPPCIALCLGMYSGQAAMVSDLEHGDNSVRRSRRNKALPMKFTLTIDCDNAAFEPDEGTEIARILRGLADILHAMHCRGDLAPAMNYLRDSNGNTVGQWRAS